MWLDTNIKLLKWGNQNGYEGIWKSLLADVEIWAESTAPGPALPCMFVWSFEKRVKHLYHRFKQYFLSKNTCQWGHWAGFREKDITLILGSPQLFIMVQNFSFRTFWWNKKLEEKRYHSLNTGNSSNCQREGIFQTWLGKIKNI